MDRMMKILISRRKQYDRLHFIKLVRASLQQEMELQRMAEFGRLGASLIHEMSTPLTAAALTLDQIRSEQPNVLLKKARQDIRQLERYVSAAKNQLKGESHETSFSLTVAIHQVVMLLSARAKSSNTKILVNTIGSIRLYGDVVKFHQIMANLINNAIEAYDEQTDFGRIVTISVSRPHQNSVSIVVSDNAKGIAPKDKARIFDPFFTTKQGKGRGLGIGLATVKKYVEVDFRGSIRVKSKLSAGTSFSVNIPLSKQP